MAAVTLANIGLKVGYTQGESGWGVPMNKNLRTLDVLAQGRVISKGLVTVPASLTGGEAYIVGASPSGALVGHTNHIAIWQVGTDIAPSSWLFVVPLSGWRMHVAGESLDYRFNGTAWIVETTGGAKPSFTANFGDGTAVSYTITHNLGTRNLHITVSRNGSPWDTIPCKVVRTSLNQVELYDFVAAPSLNQLTVHISQ